MNRTEATVIMRCKKARKIDQLSKIVDFDYKYSYWHIARICKELTKSGFLIKRKLGVVVYYIATDDGVCLATEFIKNIPEDDEMIKKQTTTTTKLSDFIVR